jgi:uncharacterized protein (TIGR03503 family)
MLVFYMLLLPYSGQVFANSENPESVNDVRILIDVSGSMKLNDPLNLRIPAIELLINLLPNNSRAGIWSFAQQTNILVPFARVDAAWKKNAMTAIEQVHSRGLLTNIEEALQIAADDWVDDATQQQRNLILLTDGMVDVGNDFMLNAESRERIISILIPMLQQAGVQVHTIALSENADRVLMEKLAFDSNGWSEIVNSADQLQRVFLQMFKKAVPQDTVPIDGNQFSIDGSIKEFSLLLFRKPGATASQLIAPDGQVFSPEKIPEFVQWLHEKNYDLVTVKTPTPGRWKISAEIDPDNQVMIVTDLKLKLNAVPNHINASDSQNLIVHFTDRNKLISRADFLSMISLKISLTNPSGSQKEWEMAESKVQKGYFTHQLGEMLSPGRYTLKIFADGKTFKREIQRTINVVDMPFKVIKRYNPETATVTLQLVPDNSVIDTSFMSIQAIIDQLPNEPRTIDVKSDNGTWSFDLKVPKTGEQIIVNFSVMAKSLQGQPITPAIQPVIIDAEFVKQLEPLKNEQASVEQAVVTPMSEELKVTPLEKNIEEPEIEADLDWKVTAGIVVAINLLLLICGYFIYRYQKKSAAVKQAQLLDRLT